MRSSYVLARTYDHRMSSDPLSPDVQLAVTLSSIMSRNRYTDDPGAVIAELQRVACDRADILAQEAGTWYGYYEDDYTRPLALALREIPGAAEWVALGQARRNAPSHSTEGFRRR